MNLKSIVKKTTELLKETARDFMDDNVLRLSAAMAYYSIFSLAPLLVIAMAIIGWTPLSFNLGEELSGTMGPVAAQAVQSMVESAAKSTGKGWAATFGVVMLFVGAAGIFGQLKDALNTIWGVKSLPSAGVMGFVRQYLLSFGMVLVIGFLLLISLVLTAALTAVTKFAGHLLPIHPLLLGIAAFLVSAGVVTTLFAFIFKVLPNATVQWRHVWAGAAVTALLFEIGKWLLGFYLGRESTASSYGAASSAVVLLLWIYYTSVILFTGAEFTRVFAKATGSPIVPEGNAAPVTAEMRAEQGLEPASVEHKLAPAPKPEPVVVYTYPPEHELPGNPISGVVLAITAGLAVGLVTRWMGARPAEPELKTLAGRLARRVFGA